MTNREWLQNLSSEELARFMDKKICCDICVLGSYDECGTNCEKNIAEWLNKKHIEPMPELKVGDVLDVVLEDGAWCDGICVAKGIVYVMPYCICKEITEIKIKAISRWNSGSMHEIWRDDDE